MNQDLINKILYLTHDKWIKSQITQQERQKHNLDRENFKEYLTMFIDKEPNCIKDLQTIVDYGQDEKQYFIIKKSVLYLLKECYPEIHKSVATRQFTYRKKMNGDTK